MMRVLHVVDAFLARSEVFIYNYITAHKRFEPVVLCRRREHENEFPFKAVEVVPDAASKYDPRRWVSRGLEELTGWTLWMRRAQAVVGRLAPDVIHAHFGPSGCAILPIARALGIPLITTFYGVDIAVLPRLPHWRPKYDALLAGGQLFLAEGPEMLRKVIAAGAPAAHTAIQRIAIAVDRYPRWKPSEGPPVVLFVGRFVEKKGLVDAVHAFSRARARIVDLTMRIIGDGPERDRARSAIAGDQVGSAVTWLGMQPHARVVDELRRARALIHPSLTAEDGDSEGGAPTILLEAQAIGTPIVSTYHADIPNVVVPGGAVRLVPERDVESLASALVDVVTARMPGDASFVRAHHNIAVEIDGLEAKYDAVVGQVVAV